MTFDDIRKIGLKLRGAEESRYFRMPALKVDGQVFVVCTSHPSAEPNSVSIAVGFEHRAKLIARDPAVFYLKPHYEPYPVVLVRLDRIGRTTLARLLRLAHRVVSTGVVVPGKRRAPSR